MSIASARPRAPGLRRRRRRRDVAHDVDLPVRVRGRKSGRRRKRGTLTFLVLLGVTAFALYLWWKRREEEHARLLTATPEPWAPPVDPTSEPPPPAPEPPIDERPEPAPFVERTAEPANGSPTHTPATPVAPAQVGDEQRASEPFVASTATPLATGEAAPPRASSTELDESGVPVTARPLGPTSVAHNEPPARQQPSADGPLPERRFAPPSSRAPLPRVAGSEPPRTS